MKKVLAAALSIIFILALTVPGFADGDTVVTMDVFEVVSPENCEWTLTIPADFSINFGDLYIKYKNYSGNGSIVTNVGTGEFSFEVSGLPKDYQIRIDTTHTPLSSPDTDTVLNYGFSDIGSVTGSEAMTMSDVSITAGDDILIKVTNPRSLTGVSGSFSKRIAGLKISDIEAIGALKAGSYSSTITFTSQLEAMA